jgi:dTDP-4-amino-4,6-dideoxygalactose transaminase
VITGDAEIASRIRQLRDHGQDRKYHHQVEGYNGRLDAIQAAFLEAKLARLPDGNRRRRDAAAEYTRLLGGAEGVIVPAEPEWSRAVYHLYVIRTANRDALIAHLASEQIGTGIHYPIPLHLQPAYAHLGYARGDFPISERLADEIVSLPMYPGVTPGQQARVADALMRFTGLSPARP